MLKGVKGKSLLGLFSLQNRGCWSRFGTCSGIHKSKLHGNSFMTSETELTVLLSALHIWAFFLFLGVRCSFKLLLINSSPHYVNMSERVAWPAPPTCANQFGKKERQLDGCIQKLASKRVVSSRRHPSLYNLWTEYKSGEDAHTIWLCVWLRSSTKKS